MRYLLTAILLFAITLLIPVTFTFYESIMLGLDKVLRAKIDPKFTGGEILASFIDALGDDYGEGSLKYPLHPHFKENGYLDIIRYNVHKPVINAPWTEAKDFWQLSFTFANMASSGTVHNFSHPVIHVYIDIDGKKGGSTETVSPRAELVRFDEEHPWDFMIHIDGYHRFGKLVWWDKSIEEKVKVYSSLEKKRIYAQILLNNEKIRAILDSRPTYHYVLVGCYDLFSTGNFMPVKAKPGFRHGGGASSSLTPKVYDYIPPKGMSQKKILSAFDEDKYLYAKLFPLVVEKTDKKEPLIELNEYKKLAEAEITQKQAEALKELEIKTYSKEKVAELYFRAGRYEEAEKAFDTILAEEPENIIATAYKGSLVAMKAQKAAPLQATKYVKQAYTYLDKAVARAKTDIELITALINRGYVSMYVPEIIFQKSKQGAADFLNAAKLLEQIESQDKKLIADCYLNAARCYENAQMPESAEIYFMKVMSLPEISATTKYELAKRGYLKK